MCVLRDTCMHVLYAPYACMRVMRRMNACNVSMCMMHACDALMCVCMYVCMCAFLHAMQ